jgi:hypothetical protein
MARIKYLTIETNIHSNAERKLLESTSINKIPITVLGKGVDWNGYVTKLQILRDYLPTLNCELVCFTDARDVLYMATDEQIVSAYDKHFEKGSVVFNADTNCFPNSANAELHPKEGEKYRFLNSGCVIGDRLLLIKIIEDALQVYYMNPEMVDDQELLQEVFLSGKHGDLFTIDYNCVIFQSIWDEKGGRSNNFDLAYAKDGIYNRLTNTKPLIFHHPGPTTVGQQAYKVLMGNYYTTITNNFF